jgi:hypothetical protein
MINQDQCKASHRKKSTSAAFNSVPLYTNTRTCRQIQAVAETMIQEQLALADRYASIRISKNKWYVGFSSEQTKHSSPDASPKPRFSRIRIVTLNEAGRLQCSCGYAERNGVPDRHLMHVTLSYGRSFDSFTQHSVAVRFWRAFNKFVAAGESSEMDSLELAIRSKLWQARHCQPIGTSVPGGFRPYQDILEYIAGEKSTAEFCCMDAAAALLYFQCHLDNVKVANYDSTTVDLVVAAMEKDSSHTVGLTQETYTADDNNEFDVGFQENNEASFSAWQCTGSRRMTSHEMLAPRLKELVSVYEDKPEKIIEVAALLDRLIQEGKAENAAMQPKPVGHCVSALAPNDRRVQHTHTKQKM